MYVTQAQVCIWNLKSIDNAKQSETDSVQTIVNEADIELKNTIVTVVDKEMVPPSGDKHDYMSMGRYWWPDPTKEDGLPYIRKDGVSNPELEKLDRNALGHFARSIKNLSLAYYLTSDDKYAQKAVENLRIWFINKETKMNPNMNFGQTIPGKRGGKGRGAGVLDTYSYVEMLDGVELLKTSKAFLVSDQEAIKKWFTDYLKWMETSEIAAEEKKAKNNHGTAFDVQVVRFALFVGNNAEAKKIITEFPAKRLFKQIKSNGAQPRELARTTALGYSTFNLTHFLDMCQIATKLNINLLEAVSSDGRGVLKAADFLVPFIGSKLADFPYKQIKDWDGVQQKLCWQLYRIDKMLPKPVYEKYYKSVIKDNAKSFLY
jgi:hypothetical protein